MRFSLSDIRIIAYGDAEVYAALQRVERGDTEVSYWRLYSLIQNPFFGFDVPSFKPAKKYSPAYVRLLERAADREKLLSEQMDEMRNVHETALAIVTSPDLDRAMMIQCILAIGRTRTLIRWLTRVPGVPTAVFRAAMELTRVDTWYTVVPIQVKHACNFLKIASETDHTHSDEWIQLRAAIAELENVRVPRTYFWREDHFAPAARVRDVLALQALVGGLRRVPGGAGVNRDRDLLFLVAEWMGIGTRR